MNFFRKRTKRNISPDQTEPKQQCGDDSRSRRHSYFSMRRRDLAAQTVAAPAMVAKLTGSDDKAGAKKSMQRRSIPGIAYLVNRRSILHTGSGSGTAEVAVPEAAMHRGTSLERQLGARLRQYAAARPCQELPVPIVLLQRLFRRAGLALNHLAGHCSFWEAHHACLIQELLPSRRNLGRPDPRRQALWCAVGKVRLQRWRVTAYCAEAQRCSGLPASGNS
ncbi:hypothetical protein IWW46_003968 [Coemansia sp. RSA 2440]|nr:hypothetical protein IWW46_003968 [Coemansia sp. RSA 2440]